MEEVGVAEVVEAEEGAVAGRTMEEEGLRGVEGGVEGRMEGGREALRRSVMGCEVEGAARPEDAFSR